MRAILASNERILKIIKDELLQIKQKFADERRTKIDMTSIDYIDDESLIPEENIVVTLTGKGYIKRLPVDTYKTQNRGGVGIRGMGTNDEDYVENMIESSSHDYILFFTNKGKVYRIKGYEIPEYGRQSKGLPIINLLNLEKNEKVAALIRVANDEVSNNLVLLQRVV